MSRMAVRAEDHLTGQHQRFLADHLMADAAPDLEEMPDSLFAHPLADFGVILSVERRRGGDGVVERHHHALRVNDGFRARFRENAADGGGVVVAEDHIGADDQHVTGAGFADASRAGEDLLGKRESRHGVTTRWLILGADLRVCPIVGAPTGTPLRASPRNGWYSPLPEVGEGVGVG